jgi:hypothetical protein
MKTQFACLALAFVLLPPYLSAQWVQTSASTGHIIECLAVSGTNLFAGTAGGGVFLSADSGTSWTAVNTGLTDTSVQSLVVSGTNLFAGSYHGDGVFLSTDSGTSWTGSNMGLPTYTSVWSLAVNGVNLFAGTNCGAFRSSDSGTSWTAASTGLPTYNTVWSLAVIGVNLFAGTSDAGVFLSADSGTSWTAVNTGLTDNSVWDLAVSGTNLFAGTYLGVFLSTTNGTSWTAASTGLTNTCVTALAISGTNLFAGTYFAGIWRRPLSEMITDVERRELLPPSFALEQNYPNPFNPNSNIRYQISEFRYIKLAVYDLLGREVAVLVNERKAPGKYEVNFDGSNLAGGVYFYRLQAGDFTQTKRLLLLK